MSRTRTLIAAAAVAGTAALASTAASAGGTAWSVSIGVPGVAVTAGTPVYGPYRPYYRPYWHRPPVVYRPYYRPYVAPRAVYYAPPVVVAPPYYAPAVPVPAY
jgi:hypothetical protein